MGDALDLYRAMLRIRRFEERLLALFREGRLRGTAHVCLGQEAVAAGACAALGPADRVASTHRGHGHLLARGGSPVRLMAEMFGRRAGYSLGRGGSQHVGAPEVGFLASNGITGGGLPLAVGSAWAARAVGPADAVTAAFFGDGASAQGTFHESMNLAALWRLPVVFVCENNGYAMGTPVAATCPAPRLADRAKGYGVPAETVDGNDPEAVRAAVAAMRARALAGEGPGFVEALTYRRGGHSRSDPAAYRDPEEVKGWLARDPILLWRDKLFADGVSVAALAAVDEEVERTIDEAVAFAEGAPALAAGFAAAGAFADDPAWAALAEQARADDARLPADPYSPAADVARIPAPSSAWTPAWPAPPAGPVDERAPLAEATYARALYLALSRALAGDPTVALLGEDIADYRGAFRVTDDLYLRYGADRVRNTPISENTIVGAAVGAAMAGMRPVVEIMFMDFLLLALDQLANHAAKFPYLFRGRPVPMVLRTPAGGRRGYGATHSQCFETLLLSIPGLKIFTPATVQDAYDLLLAAIADPGPVAFVEHKLLYGVKGPLDPSAAPTPPGRARVVRPGRDLTIVTFGEMARHALAAAEALAAEGIAAEVVDLRTLAPLDLETPAASASRTQRVLVAEEGVLVGGVGAEIAARLQEACFGYLDAPVLRVGARSCPVPTEAALERAVLPEAADIAAAARRLLAGG